MATRRKLEQHIAVFGESGSGKTVLLSSFYGAYQEPEFFHQGGYSVVADDIGQGAALHSNYLGMKDLAEPPVSTHFSATSYSFTIGLRDTLQKTDQRAPFDALRLVWHDYPGEWFEHGASGPEEAKRRAEAFAKLVRSDVAFLLVDGQRLLDHRGDEARYLKSLLGNIRNGLLSLRDDILDGGKPATEFPRIWIMALSKADLLPELDVFGFRDLLVRTVAPEMDALRQAIATLIEGDDALAVGEDFLLLSSAKFDPDRIDVAERIGIDLILPIAALLPFERHVRWVGAKLVPANVANELLRNASAITGILAGRVAKIPRRVLQVLKLFDFDLIDNAARLAGEQLEKLNAQARAKHEQLRTVLSGFKLELERGEQRRVLLRSRR